MKAAIVSCLTIVLAVVLIVGNLHWNLKEKSPLSPVAAKETESSATPDKTESYFSLDYYVSFAKHWPEPAKKVLEKRLEDRKAFHIVLLGSRSIGSKEVGLAPLLQKSLSESFDEYVTVESIVFDGTSSEFVKDEAYKELVASNADMVLFEPFLLNDNNVVNIFTTIENVSTVIKTTKSELPDVTFVLQPAHQIYAANLYPMQVKELQAYAEKENIPYWNHWEVWPDGKDEAVLEYITSKSNSVPNEKGYELWSNYLKKILISK